MGEDRILKKATDRKRTPVVQSIRRAVSGCGVCYFLSSSLSMALGFLSFGLPHRWSVGVSACGFLTGAQHN